MSGSVTPALSPLQQQALAVQQQQQALGALAPAQQLNLLGIPANLPQGQSAWNNAGLGSLYNAVANYARTGNAANIPTPLLGSAINAAFPAWSPMAQLAALQIPQTQAADASAIASALQPPAPPQLSDEEQARMQARAGNEGGSN